LMRDLRRAPIREIIIGTASKAWVRARLTGKRYVRSGVTSS